MSLVTVFGATGNQGGSVINTILSDPALSKKYKIRAVTRDTTKESAKALAARGAETVQADLNDPASVAAAVKDSYAVFGVTDFWSLLSKDKEMAQGKAIADAAIDAKVTHLIWSSLPHATRLTGGKLNDIPHFDSKAEVEEHIEAKKVGTSTKATYYMPGAYATNLVGTINPGPDGVLTWGGSIDPDSSRIPWIDVVADTGKYVVGLLEAGPEATDGARIQAVSHWASPRETMEIFTKTNGKEYKYAQLPRDVFKGFLPPQLAEELVQTFELMGSYHYYGLNAEKNQEENDRFLLKGSKKTSLPEFIKNTGGW